MSKLTIEWVESFQHLFRIRAYENDLRRVPLETEHKLTELVRQGKPQEINMHRFSAVSSNMGAMAFSETKQLEYTCVSMIAVFSRLVVECGVRPDDAFDLSDVLLLMLSDAKDMETMEDIYRLAPVLFARQVERLNRNRKSFQVEQCCNYIRRNIFRKITLKELGEYVELNPNYLTTIFSKEMGISISNYIQQEKIDIAANLLMHTDRPISEIATYLGYQSQSNFAIVFKKWHKESPSAYRARTYREVF